METKQISEFAGFRALLKRDLKLAFRKKSDVLNPLAFFLMVVSLFPMAVSTEPKVLSSIGAGVVWTAALLSMLLSFDSLFKDDFDDGSLEQLVISPQPLYVHMIAKVLVQWMITGLPLAVSAPLLGVMLHLPTESLAVLSLSLLIGTPSLSLIGAIGAALTLGLKRGGVLLSLLILPLAIPVLIFGTSAVMAAAGSLAFSGQLAFLGAYLSAAMVLAPFAIAAAVRLSVS